MKVLLTRPEGRNQLMAEALTKRNVSYFITPLLNVQPTSNLDAQQIDMTLKQADIIIFISTNAVSFASKAINNQWPTSAHYLAVGDATHAALSDIGLDAEKAPEDCQQTEGLLTLPTLTQVNGKNILIVRGQGGREDLATELTKRQARLNYWEVYKRGCPALDAACLCQQWQSFGIDTIIITSGEILDNLVKTVPKELFAWLQTCHIIVPSSRVYEKAKAYGLVQISNATAANTNAMLATLSLK
ncbi:Uroporphyrinogen III synthase HEM4 [Shewanella halifaxensis HAW-EB4]|uniref:Uroporphyrinogen-III synthase n=1 Tax=Shewanella halifaxensis (strain HAW-EB4) TaxID=458817 RepID=B0TJ55_SHEHH|nr:uroporphyrinogen-III synthase [Shewanella halifaxensis]ABZ78458.1 Uroporphyrinogen III synthase HEM4 [Shewanella halifaxensis HAW-EB4]